MALGAVAGLAALAAGVAYRRWRVAAPVGAAAVIFTAVLAQFNPQQSDLLVQLGGIVLLGVGGVVGAMAYGHFVVELQRRADEVAGLSSRLDVKHHAFVAATSDLNGTRSGDTTAITAAIAANVSADFACCYLTSADGRRFVPQPPGVGVEHLRPQAVNRPRDKSGPMLTAIEARTWFDAADENGLAELLGYLPDDFHLKSLLAVPMPMDDHIGGFVVLGRTQGQFSD